MSKFEYYKIVKTKSHVYISFAEKQKCLSSSIFNGGNKKIDSVLVLKVEENFKGKKMGLKDLK